MENKKPAKAVVPAHGAVSLEAAVRLFAAAFCASDRCVKLRVPHTADEEALLRVVRELRGRAKFLANGQLSVRPVKYGPVFEGIRLDRVSGDCFLFLAGVCVSQCIAVCADSVPDPPSDAALNAVLRCTCRVACIRRTADGGMRCGMSVPAKVYCVTPDTPEAFAAGLIVGAMLGWTDTDLLFKRCDPAPLHLFALDAVREFGGTVQTLTEGVRICTLRDRLPPLPENLRNKHDFDRIGVPKQP